MTRPRLFSWNPVSRRKTIIHQPDGERGDTIFDMVQDAEPTIEHVKRLRDLPPGKDYLHVASVPMIIYMKAQKEGWDDRDWARWLNDPDNAVFRVHGGRV